MSALAIFIILLGLVTLAFGTRLALFGAAIGALLGLSILRILPGSQDNLLWLIVPVGLAILFALGSGLAKGLVGLLSLALGALAGGAIVLALLDLFGLDWGLTNWILAFIGAVIGAVLMSRFKDWALIILTGFIGALLTVRGLQMLIPAVQGIVASLIGLLLLVGGIAYHGGFLGGGKQKNQ